MNCVICGTEFPPITGRQVCCTPACSKERQRQNIKKWEVEHADRLRKLRQKWFRDQYAANPEKFKRKSRDYRLSHPDEVRRYAREYKREQFASNPDKFRAQQREWYAKNAERLCAKKRKPRPAKVCIVCGTKFRPRTKNHSCCKPECSHKYQRKQAQRYARHRWEENPDLMRQRSREHYWRNVEMKREEAKRRARALRASAHRGGQHRNEPVKSKVLELDTIGFKPGEIGKKLIELGLITRKDGESYQKTKARAKSRAKYYVRQKNG